MPGAGGARSWRRPPRTCTTAGVRMLLLPEGDWATHARVYTEQGFTRLERVIYYQLLGLEGGPVVTRPLPPLEFAPLTAPHLDAILAVDHAAFPWLWWNAEAEFRVYHAQAGVQVWLGAADGVPVAYAGFTMLERWAHLDRLAVDPAWHGHGYGAAMLSFALRRMAAAGANRVTLSTQETNTQSQRLYRGFGFRQTTRGLRHLRPLAGRVMSGSGSGHVTRDRVAILARPRLIIRHRDTNYWH